MDFRTVALGIGVFCATFAIGWWFDIASLASVRSAAVPIAEAQAPAASVATVAQRVAVQTPPTQAPQPKWNGPGLVKQKPLRDALMSWSEKYRNPPCHQDVHWGYIKSATEYAGALLRAAGCTTQTCRMSNGGLQEVWEARRSALDRPVAEAMAAAHAAGGLSPRSFRGEVSRAVLVIADREFAPGPAPQCRSASSGIGGWRVRGQP